MKFSSYFFHIFCNISKISSPLGLAGREGLSSFKNQKIRLRIYFQSNVSIINKVWCYFYFFEISQFNSKLIKLKYVRMMLFISFLTTTAVTLNVLPINPINILLASSSECVSFINGVKFVWYHIFNYH
jgi:hypothetical protein